MSYTKAIITGNLCRDPELKAQNERLKKLLHHSNCNTRYLMTAIRSVYTDERMDQIEELQDEIENALK